MNETGRRGFGRVTLRDAVGLGVPPAVQGEAELEAWLHEPVEGRCRCGAALRRFEKLNAATCWDCTRATFSESAEGSEGARAVARWLEAAGVPARYRGYTLEAWRGEIPADVLAWANDPRETLFLCGPTGTGKTHLAAIAFAIAVAGGDVPPRWSSWQSCRTLPRELAAERVFGDGGARPLWRLVSRVPVLVLDDLGTEPATEWAADQVGAVLDARYQGALATVVTSNLTLSEIYRADARVGSRLAAGAVVVPLAGPDRRVAPFGR